MTHILPAAPSQQTFPLPINSIATVDVLDSLTVGRVALLIAQNDKGRHHWQVIAPGRSAVFGPLPTVRYLFVECETGDQLRVSIIPATANRIETVGDAHCLRTIAGHGAPTSEIGADIAGVGSIYIDQLNGALYLNKGTRSVPAWKMLQVAP